MFLTSSKFTHLLKFLHFCKFLTECDNLTKPRTFNLERAVKERIKYLSLA